MEESIKITNQTSISIRKVLSNEAVAAIGKLSNIESGDELYISRVDVIFVCFVFILLCFIADLYRVTITFYLY